jgi:hypothetical protein
MSVEVDTTSAPKRLIITVTDPWPTIEDFSSLRRRLIDAGHLTEASRALIDIRDVSTPDYHEATGIVAAGIKSGALPRHRAYLVGSAVQFGFVQQLKSLAPKTMEIEIFTNQEQALMWLHLDPEEQ